MSVHLTYALFLLLSPKKRKILVLARIISIMVWRMLDGLETIRIGDQRLNRDNLSFSTLVLKIQNTSVFLNQ